MGGSQYQGLSDDMPSGVATGEGGTGGRVPPLTVKSLPKRGGKSEKSGKIGKKKAKVGKVFPFAPLTDRAGYATLKKVAKSASWYNDEPLFSVKSGVLNIGLRHFYKKFPQSDTNISEICLKA